MCSICNTAQASSYRGPPVQSQAQHTCIILCASCQVNSKHLRGPSVWQTTKRAPSTHCQHLYSQKAVAKTPIKEAAVLPKVQCVYASRCMPVVLTPVSGLHVVEACLQPHSKPGHICTYPTQTDSPTRSTHPLLAVPCKHQTGPQARRRRKRECSRTLSLGS